MSYPRGTAGDGREGETSHPRYGRAKNQPPQSKPASTRRLLSDDRSVVVEWGKLRPQPLTRSFPPWKNLPPLPLASRLE